MLLARRLAKIMGASSKGGYVNSQGMGAEKSIRFFFSFPCKQSMIRVCHFTMDLFILYPRMQEVDLFGGMGESHKILVNGYPFGQGGMLIDGVLIQPLTSKGQSLLDVK